MWALPDFCHPCTRLSDLQLIHDRGFEDRYAHIHKVILFSVRSLFLLENHTKNLLQDPADPKRNRGWPTYKTNLILHLERGAKASWTLISFFSERQKVQAIEVGIERIVAWALGDRMRHGPHLFEHVSARRRGVCVPQGSRGREITTRSRLLRIKSSRG